MFANPEITEADVAQFFDLFAETAAELLASRRAVSV